MLTSLLDRRVDARPLAITRILAGAGALLLAAESYAVLTRAASADHIAVPALPWSPAVTPGLVAALFAVWTVAAVLLVVGLHSRLAAGAVALSGITALLLDQQAYSNHLTLMVVLAALLAVARPGAAWALDSRRAGGSPTVPYWPLWLIMVQLSTLYAFTALSKLNPSFLAGEPLVAYARDIGGFSVTDLPAQLLPALALAAVLTELFLAFALWSDRRRPAAFVAGFGLHAGILVTVGPAPQLLPFALLVLSPYVLFVRATPRVVVWDDGCSFCARAVAVLRRLDWLGLHDFRGSSDPAILEATGTTRAQAEAAMQLVEDGRRLEGYDAVRAVLEACPATFLLAPLMRVPPVRAVGVRVYARVALRRTCALQPATS